MAEDLDSEDFADDADPKEATPDGEPEGGELNGSMSHWATPSEIPAFEQGKTGPIHVIHDPNEEVGDVSEVSRYDARQFPGSNTVHVANPAQWNGGTPQHEYTHVYEDKVLGLGHRLFEGGNGDDQDYGGTPGMEQHNAQGKTIAQLNPEQRAESVGDAWAAQKKVVADAKAGTLKPGELEAFDRVKSAFHPTLQQMKNEGDATIDTHPAAPGLPPASVSGIVAPDDLLGGEWASATHYLRPGNGKLIDRGTAEQYMDKAGNDPARARQMAQHDGHQTSPQDPLSYDAGPSAGGKVPGLMQRGNIDVNHRPIVKNADGTSSTIFSMTVPIGKDGKSRAWGDPGVTGYALVPSLANGKFLTPDGKKPDEKDKDAMGKLEDAATAYYNKTGQHLGVFKSDKDANTYAGMTHAWMPDGTSRHVYVPSPKATRR